MSQFSKTRPPVSPCLSDGDIDHGAALRGVHPLR